jgi:hypothetical protein
MCCKCIIFRITADIHKKRKMQTLRTSLKMLFVEMTNHLQFIPSSLREVMLCKDKVMEAAIKVGYSQRNRRM